MAYHGVNPTEASLRAELNAANLRIQQLEAQRFPHGNPGQVPPPPPPGPRPTWALYVGFRPQINNFQHQNTSSQFQYQHAGPWTQYSNQNQHPNVPNSGYNQGTQPMQTGPQPFVQPHNTFSGNTMDQGFERHSAFSTPVAAFVAQRIKLLEEHNEKVLALLSKLPGAAVPVDVEPPAGFQTSPFFDAIALIGVPKKYNIPTFTPKYSGLIDPNEHVAEYKQLMWTVSIPLQYKEVCMCKSFRATLTGAALQWLINLKPKSISSFADLANQFFQQFSSSRKMEKQTGDVYYVIKKIW